MKRFNLNRFVVAIAMMLIGWLPSLAHDFEVDGIFYNKTVGNTVSVAYKGNGVNDYENEYSGAVNIPSSVTYNGTTYSVTSIAKNALKYCSNVTSVSIPNTVTSIGDASVAHTSITTIDIPNSVTYVGENAFNSCKLKTVNVGGGAIGDQAFAYNSNLTELTLGEKVTYIESGAFYNCKKLTKITCLATTPPTISKSDAFSNYSANLYVPVGRVSAYQSADHWKNFNVKEIVSHEVGAMFSVNGLNYVITVKEQEVAVDKWSTNYYSGDIVIPQSVEYGDVAYSVTSIGKYAFDSCGRLTSIKIPNSVKSIGIYAFYSCNSLTSIEIPNSVTSIDSNAFLDCIGVTEITCHATTPPTIYTNTFSHYSATLYVPAGCISAYQSANYWKNFNIKEIPTISTSIVLNKTSVSLKATETLTLVATVLPENATNKSVTWKSSNEAVATVDANGKVTAVAVGEATITATTADGSNKSATCKITVAKTLAESISLDKTSATLKATEILTLKATIAPATTTDKSVTWKSSNEAVATVDANGKVTAVSVGEATITTTTADGSNKSATCKITVAKKLAESVTLDKTSATLKATETLTLKATVAPATTTDKSVTWTSSNTSVATVDANGKVTAVAVGEATITATTADGSNKSATCKIIVAKTLATSISLDKTSATLKATEILTLKATIAPTTTTNKSVNWKSSNEAVATVDANGKVTAVAVGEATITATTADGSNKSATCKITVAKTLATSISLDKTSATLKATETLTLKATVSPATTTDKSVTWTSSNEAVATVDANGKVTAVAVGEATITATTADGSNKSATCKITVAKTLAESVTLDKTSATLKATETLTLKATVAPTTTTDKSVTWTSSNTSVATVDANGKVTAVAVGEATITATTADGSNKSATCKITVAKTLATSISLDKTSATLKATETLTLKATVAPATTTDKSVTWKSSNEAVATVDANGKVTAVAVGEATITATTADGSNKSATCKITVAKTLATSISLDKTSATLKATETLTLKATIAPATTTNKSVTWKSSNETVATVDANGKVTAVAVGEATITATTADGSNKSATCKITVAKTLATSISLDKTSATLKATETLTLKATVAPATTTNKSMTWTSSNTSVATVDANGKVTAVSVGEATITATTADGSNKSATCKITVAKTLATSISLDKTSATLKATETLTLKATIAPATTTDKSVTWKSSNEAVATVDANGKVNAVAVGEATITATTADGSNLSATCVVTVDATLAASLILNSDEINLKATETATLIATIYPELTTDKSVDWKSSNESVAVVDRNGVVTAIGVGTATITATTTDGTNLSASCVVNVIPTLANSIVLDITAVSLKATQTVVLTPMILPDTTTDANVTWMSSDESVAVVDEDGLVTAIGVGTAIITATTADGSNLSATCVVTVLPTPGDVNNDASVNVTDIVTVASYIVGKTTDVFIFEAADMTKDGKINVTDIVGIASIILNGGSASNVSAQRCAPNSSDAIKIEDFAAGKNQSQQVAIEMTNASDYSACQMDIRLPMGMSIAECELASAATDHMVAYRELPDGAVRVLVYSLTCRTLPDSEEGIIRLRTTTDNRFEGGEIVVENILFADHGQNEYRLYDSVANVNLATGVLATDMDCVVYAENQSIVIISPCDQQATITSVDGVSRTYSLNEGCNEIAAPQSGIYIVTLADRTSKVMVK